MGAFSDDLAKFEAKTSEKLTVAVRKISLELFRRVILRSPVDTGRFRANWQVTIGSLPSGTLELDDKTGNVTIDKADAVISGVQGGDIVVLTNNLPYSKRLEEGYSQQAPQGFVALSVQEFQAIANEIGLEIVRI